MISMDVTNATNARKDLFQLIDRVADHHVPCLITGKRNNAVLISEEDWRGLQETLYLNSIPGMAESIVEASNAPDSEFVDSIEW